MCCGIEGKGSVKITALEEILPLTPQELHTLSALTLRPMSSYGLRQQIIKDSGELITPSTGTVHKILQRFVADWLVEEIDPADLPGWPQSKRLIRLFQLSSRGRAVLDAELTRLERLASLTRHRML